MKIKKISPICIHMPFEHGAEKKELYGQNWKKLEFVFVKVEMDNGVIGWGEAFGYVSWKPVKIAIEEMVAPLLIGSKIENSNDIIEISNKIQKTLHIFGRYGITMFAISGIEIAIWDALGKDKKVPLHELLGKKKKSEFSAYASLFRYSNNNLVEKKCILLSNVQQVKICLEMCPLRYPILTKFTTANARFPPLTARLTPSLKVDGRTFVNKHLLKQKLDGLSVRKR